VDRRACSPEDTCTPREIQRPAGVPISARLPELPYQLVLKLIALATPPVGIDEDRRADAVPRQLYDLDLLLAALREERQWQTMADYEVFY
jgi:hypothetical protein